MKMHIQLCEYLFGTGSGQSQPLCVPLVNEARETAEFKQHL